MRCVFFGTAVAAFLWLSAPLFVFGQTSIPNFSFENWEKIDTGRFERPAGWKSLMAAGQLAAGDTPRIYRSNTAKNGDYSVAITTAPDSGGIATGDELSAVFMFKGMPTELKGFYQLSGLAVGIGVELWAKDSLGQWLQTATGFAQMGATSGWAEWSIPLHYTWAETSVKCSLAINFPATAVGHSGHTLLLDALSFSNKSLGLDASAGNLAAWPNPAKDFLYLPETITTATLTALDGKLYTLPVTSGQIELSALAPGLYKLAAAGFTQKIVKLP